MANESISYTVMVDLRGYFTLKQIEDIIRVAHRPRDKLLFRLLSRTGRRITEIIGRKQYTHKNSTIGFNKTYPAIRGLQPQDINWEEETIVWHILKKKALVRRIKPIDKTSLLMLWNYINDNNIAPDQNIFEITRFRVYQVLRECCEELGIYHIGTKPPHPHHFRHSFAIHLLRASKDSTGIKKIQMALEHSNLNVTSGYLQFEQEEIKKLQKDAFGDY